MTHQAPETSELVDALRAALTGQSMPVHVGHLRLQVERILGPERAREQRREIHQVMVAAEEHLPSRLIQVRPLTVATLARVASELAATRSWGLATAERTTRIWAAALGFEHLAEVEWPTHVPALRPSASIDSLDIGLTAAPPEPPRRDPDVEAKWPKPSKRLAKNHPLSSAGETPLGIGQAYANMPVAVYAGLLLALLIVLIAAYLVTPPLIGLLLPFVGFGVATAVSRLAGQGALVATVTGVEFVPYQGVVGRPGPEPSHIASWSGVEVQAGAISTVTLQGHKIQLGPLGRAFAEAAATQAGGGR